jgi:hypothetical protein
LSQARVEEIIRDAVTIEKKFIIDAIPGIIIVIVLCDLIM